MIMSKFSHRVFTDTFSLNASPEAVFPLLCPVREHEWIPTWKAEILHTDSGYAELDCSFVTDNLTEGKRIWICTQYEPHRAVAYASYSELGYIMRLEIALEPLGVGGAHITWSRRFVATTPQGDAWVSALESGAASKATQKLASLLEHFLTTGEMLRA
jgi:hypothetical protein